MESEDDMHDANDSADDDFYSGGEAGLAASDDGDADYDFADHDSDDSAELLSHRQQQNYSILSEVDIKRRQEDDINRVSTVLSISKPEACVLLRNYNWSVSKVHDEWFADEERVRKVVGLPEKHIELPNDREVTCGICFESCPRGSMSAAACGHPFCGTCWRGYISTAISDGPGCLMLRCPDPSCAAAVGQDMINSLADDEDKEKYGRYLRRSYIEDNRKTKWCPAPGCEYAVEFVMGSGSYDVNCNCSYGFCWNCTEEAHRPVDCATVSKWILKNSAESENMNWILANSKPCPKCKRPIEKNQGCMHITCTPPCKFEFCWLCLGPWSEHGERTGGFYACNRYESARQEGAYDESERRREMAKNSLERYTHYYERWAANQSSRQKALGDLQSLQNDKLEKLSDIQSQPESQLKFIIEAWLQIVECRRVLKWTYAYGFYLPEHEHAKRQFFEYLQATAAFSLSLLSPSAWFGDAAAARASAADGAADGAAAARAPARRQCGRRRWLRRRGPDVVPPARLPGQRGARFGRASPWRTSRCCGRRSEAGEVADGPGHRRLGARRPCTGGGGSIVDGEIPNLHAIICVCQTEEEGVGASAGRPADRRGHLGSFPSDAATGSDGGDPVEQDARQRSQ